MPAGICSGHGVEKIGLYFYMFLVAIFMAISSEESKKRHLPDWLASKL